MELKLTDQRASIVSYNARAENHGDEVEAAADLKLVMDVQNDFLAQLSPTLKGSLFFHDPQFGDADLADAGSDAPHLRYPRLALPLKWQDEMSGARVEIHLKGARRAVVLSPAKVNGFSLEPKQGGTVTVEFRIQFHPDEAIAGRLATAVKQEVSVSISEAPEEAAGAQDAGGES